VGEGLEIAADGAGVGFEGRGDGGGGGAAELEFFDLAAAERGRVG
jgi:hypothetical protein